MSRLLFPRPPVFAKTLLALSNGVQEGQAWGVQKQPVRSKHGGPSDMIQATLANGHHQRRLVGCVVCRITFSNRVSISS